MITTRNQNNAELKDFNDHYFTHGMFVTTPYGDGIVLTGNYVYVSPGVKTKGNGKHVASNAKSARRTSRNSRSLRCAEAANVITNIYIKEDETIVSEKEIIDITNSKSITKVMAVALFNA